MVYLLNETYTFPNPEHGEPDGLIAIGGDLSFGRLLFAYNQGIFPWFSFRDSEMPYWYCPLERFVIFPDEIHISHSMRTQMNKGRYRISMNEDFEGVIRNCSKLRIEEQGAWLGEDMIKAYTALHEKGFAASVEVWDGDNLVGGLYGVYFQRVFFGESMFSLVPNGSKFALIYLAQHMAAKGDKFIDCQFETPHLKSMGGRIISYDEYMQRLRHYD